MSSMQKNKFNRIFDRILSITVIMTGILVLFLLITVVIDVALRNLTGRPTIWIVEISGHILFYLPFLAAAWALKNEKHVKMDLLFNYMSPKSQALLNTIMYFIGAIICIAIAWLGTDLTIELVQTGFLTQGVIIIPRWPIVIIIPIGFVLLVIEFIRRALLYLGTWKAAGSNQKPVITQPAETQGGH